MTNPGVYPAFKHMQLRQAPAQPPQDLASGQEKKKESYDFSSTFSIPTGKASPCVTAPVS